MDTRGYLVYRRQDNGSTARVKGCTIDNRWVIPYNLVLSLMFNAHINVEVCSTIQAVKYLYKYIYKGHDRATVRFHAAQDDGQRQHVDEIDMYLDGRYVSASKACWRIFDFPLHSDAPDVQRLSVHVPSGQMVTFQDHDRLGDVLQRDTLEKTTLTEWFACNVENPEANDTLYIDFLQKWVWNSSSKKWTKRHRGDTIGRMYFVQPSAGERYYVRLLLTICKGFLNAIAIGRGSIFFLDGPAGTGKTYLYNCLLSRVRGEGAIALATASSGIFALLLKNGRTAHSWFKIPLDVDNCSTCNIPVQGHLAELIRVCKLIVWDEAPMTNRNAFEAFDRTLQDIMCSRKFFGGKVLLLGGDFRQILQVVPKGSRLDIVNATLCCSYLWPQVTVLRLFDNMRMRGDDIADIAYRKWLMDVGNGTLTSHEDHTMAIPSDMVLSNQSMDGLISYVYSDMNRHLGDAIYSRDRAILAPRNSDVDIAKTLCAMSGDIVEYFSVDSIIADSMQPSFLYSVEFLNGLNLGGGFPVHYL
ncbi:hypothetical protein L7F22_039945 [Adiantum nelumboides]|nr:hypothetical protein [Adiantum nelumboides]